MSTDNTSSTDKSSTNYNRFAQGPHGPEAFDSQRRTSFDSQRPNTSGTPTLFSTSGLPLNSTNQPATQDVSNRYPEQLASLQHQQSIPPQVETAEWLIANQQFSLAVDLLKVLHDLDPNNVQCLSRLGFAAYKAHDFTTALYSTSCLLSLIPPSEAESIKLNHAKALYYLLQAEEALAIITPLHKANRPIGNCSTTDIALDYALYNSAIGNFDETFKTLQGCDQSDLRVQSNYGYHYLLRGEFLKGFQHLAIGGECRAWGSEYLNRLPRDRRYVAGTSLLGKTILVANEGGLGDEMMFGRFCQILKHRGAKTVIVGCSPHLVTFFQHTLAVDVAGPLDTVKHLDWDYYIPSMNFPALLELEHPSDGITFPYCSLSPGATKLPAPSALPPALPPKYNNYKKPIENVSEANIENVSEANIENVSEANIGLRWSGNPMFEFEQFRTVTTQHLQPLLDLGNCYAFQRENTDQGEQWPRKSISHLTFLSKDQLDTWDSTVGYLRSLDHLVSSCTSLVHCAGSMSLPVSVLVPYCPYFPWVRVNQLGGISDWYPTVKVYRQSRYNDWSDTCAKLVSDLSTTLSST